MGIYIYGVSVKTIATEIGPVHASYYIAKDTFSRSGLTEAKINRAHNNFAEAPSFFVLGNPKDKDHLARAKRTGKPVTFHVCDNRDRKAITFFDSATFPVVGTIDLSPEGKLSFSATK